MWAVESSDHERWVGGSEDGGYVGADAAFAVRPCDMNRGPGVWHRELGQELADSVKRQINRHRGVTSCANFVSIRDISAQCSGRLVQTHLVKFAVLRVLDVLSCRLIDAVGGIWTTIARL